MRQLPPYSKEIADARRRGLVPARGSFGHIAIGFEWRLDIVPDFPVVVFPPGRAAAEFNWKFVAGLDVFIMHRDSDIPRLHALCCELFSARANDVQTFNMDKASRGEKRGWLRLIPLWGKRPCQN